MEKWGVNYSPALSRFDFQAADEKYRAMDYFKLLDHVEKMWDYALQHFPGREMLIRRAITDKWAELIPDANPAKAWFLSDHPARKAPVFPPPPAAAWREQCTFRACCQACAPLESLMGDDFEFGDLESSPGFFLCFWKRREVVDSDTQMSDEEALGESTDDDSEEESEDDGAAATTNIRPKEQSTRHPHNLPKDDYAVDFDVEATAAKYRKMQLQELLDHVSKKWASATSLWHDRDWLVSRAVTDEFAALIPTYDPIRDFFFPDSSYGETEEDPMIPLAPWRHILEIQGADGICERCAALHTFADANELGAILSVPVHCKEFIVLATKELLETNRRNREAQRLEGEFSRRAILSETSKDESSEDEDYSDDLFEDEEEEEEL
ncbi:hypothetical protein BU16DRAFT_231698 [Lophium mytilinum]|uniref:Uncharacterized protein n=1 Tax=Lophium mytilinum TaxID=390894 RepID=A0A6A6R5T7_9PEZI|nr:hypothetical protein BU16DRAFT_231698 [Lophium mytilinum]